MQSCTLLWGHTARYNNRPMTRGLNLICDEFGGLNLICDEFNSSNKDFFHTI